MGLVLLVNYRAIGLTIFIIVLLAFIALFIRNVFLAKPEVGSEIELAANRKEYYGDEDLEGKRLDRSLTFALGMLCFIALGTAFYTIAEPGRQDGAVEARDAAFVRRGEANYIDKGCVGCHSAGGVGGSAPYILQDADGQFIANASWQAPALNNILLRYSEEEIVHILNYGRSGSPMAAWGTPGGGPLTEQSVINIVKYLETLQVQSLDPNDIMAAGDDNPENDPGSMEDEESAAAAAEAEVLTADIRKEVERSIEDGEFETLGEAVFNLGLYSGYQGGSLSCARCHTAQWSLGPVAAPQVLDEGIAGCGGGVSGIGFSLCGGSVENRFPADTWKMANGEWMPLGGLADEVGKYIEAADGSKIYLDDKDRPVTESGELFIILEDALLPADSTAQIVLEEAVESEEAALEEIEPEGAEQENVESEEPPAASASSNQAGLGSPGSLASCAFVSKLHTPAEGATYSIDPSLSAVEFDADGNVIEPEPLDISSLSGDVYQLKSGKIVSDCEITEMPERTSQAQYDFVYNGAEIGKPYGNGGQSSAGMMPAFGKMLPAEYIQAVIDYERGLE